MVKIRCRWIVVACILGLAGIAGYLHLPLPSESIVPSVDTTRLLGPLKSDGTVDYVAFLDTQMREGVTAENNAAGLLFKVGVFDVAPEQRVELAGRYGLPKGGVSVDITLSAWQDHRETSQELAASKPEEGKDTRTSRRTPSVADAITAIETDGLVPPQLEPWLEENALILDLLSEASLRPKLYLSLISTTSRPLLADAWPKFMAKHTLNLMHALGARARFRAIANDAHGACTDVLSLHRLARLLDQAPDPLAAHMARAMDREAASAMVFIATRCQLPPDEARNLLGELTAMGPASVMSRSLDTHRFMLLDMVQMIIRGSSTKATSVSPNEMLCEVNRCLDALELPLKSTDQPGAQVAQALDAKQDAMALEAVSVGYVRLLWIGGRACRQERSRITARALMGSQTPVFFRSILSAEAHRQLEIAAVAITVFHAENGQYPQTLAALVPSVLKVLPVDPWTGQALKYVSREDGCQVYSVGPNGADEGGSSGSCGDDVGLQISSIGAVR